MQAEKLIDIALDFIGSMEELKVAEDRLRNAEVTEDDKALRNYILKKALAEDQRKVVRDFMKELGGTT